MSNFLKTVKENPRLIILVSALVVQALEMVGIQVDSSFVENAVDVVTILALGRVMQKSEKDKLI